MAKLTKVEITSATITAKVKLDKDEAQNLLDPAKVEAFLATNPPLAIQQIVDRRDEEQADHDRRREAREDAEIDQHMDNLATRPN